MSTKPEKQDSPTSKVLQKARSFKHDLKSRIKRTPSASRADKDTSPSRKARHHGSRKRVGRTSSFNEGCKTDADGKTISDAELLDQDSIKVYSAIKYLRDVVNKGVLEQLSGATNIVLESVTDILQSVSKHFINQDSTLLTATHNEVYQSLAKLIKWSDHMMLDRSQPLDKKNVTEFIDPLEKGIMNLLRLSKEKLITRDTNNSLTVQRSLTHRKTSSEGRSTPVSDPIPLSPEELRLLDEGDAIKSHGSPSPRASPCPSPRPSPSPSRQRTKPASTGTDLPPPKPPLPPNFTLRGSRKLQSTTDEDDVFSNDASQDSTPPPLPAKQKSRTHSSYDNASEVYSTDNTGSELLPGNLKVSSLSPGQRVPSPQGSLHLSPNDCPVSIAINQTSPRSGSPTSSISSARSASSAEYLLDDSPGNRSRSVSSASTGLSQRLEISRTSEQRLSHYDNTCPDPPPDCDNNTTTSVSVSQSGTQSFAAIKGRFNTEDQISQVTRQIKQFVSTHSSSSFHDSTGIYDNKQSISSIYDNKLSSGNDALPPPLPEKQKRPSLEVDNSRPRIPSVYDNMSHDAQASSAMTSSSMAMAKAVSETTSSAQQGQRFIQNKSAVGTASATHNTKKVIAGGRQYTTESSTVSRTVQMRYVKETFSNDGDEATDGNEEDDDEPPPLPLKKRHVEEYMQIFGQSSGPSAHDLTRRSVRSMHFYKEQWQQHQMEVFLPPMMYPRSQTFSLYSGPEYPRESMRVSDLLSLGSGTSGDTQRASDVLSIVSGTSSEDSQVAPSPVIICPSPSLPDRVSERMAKGEIDMASRELPELPAKQRSSNTSSSSGVSSRKSDPIVTPLPQNEATKDQDVKLSPEKKPQTKENDSEKRSVTPTPPSPSLSPAHKPALTNGSREAGQDTDSAYSDTELSIMDEEDVSHHLVMKTKDEDGQELRGGCVDALVVHATVTGKNELLYQEAFLTTYRTLLTSHELVEKLIYRYNRFNHMNDVKKKKLSRNAFSLLTRVVNELCTEVDEKLIELLMDLVEQMLCDGELTLARVFRTKVLEKCHYLRRLREESKQGAALWPQYKVSTRQYSLFNFKSQDIAEQMTVLDAELFEKIEIPEVLLWAREQNEEQSPNLTRFTEHFNKMSYWCRTRILEQEEPKDREHCYVKFIKIMRHLEKFNNFNSYLAVLSALSSSPVARLDWQKQNTEAVQQYFQLIDNTHGFRTYRQRLAETEPPCIPYIGLVLQDLTFVHVGNKDWIREGIVNFIKRWQQFNILDNMRRFRKCNYGFSKKEKIAAFFSNFDNYLPEETLWQISEAIKPPKRTVYKN